MSTVNIGSALPTGTNTIGQVKLVDTGGTNQAAIDANNNVHVAIYNAANSMAIDSSNNAHVGVWNGANQLAVNSGGNAAMNVAQISGSAVSTAATGVQKVGIVGNAGATVDSTIAAGTAPTNALVMGAVYNASPPAPTSGQSMAIQLDQAGNSRMFPGMVMATLSAWNSSTSLNATQTIFTNSGAPAVLVQLTQTSTLTAGAINFEVSYDGSNWSTIPANCVLDPTSSTFAQISLPYTLQASTNKAILINSNGAQGLRIKLSTVITGTGSVTPNYALLPDSPADTVIALSPTAANFSVNAAQFGGSNVVTGTGASGSGIPRVTVSNDSQVQVWDGTNGPVAVKAANTSPVLVDKAQVHAISPNNTGLPVNLPAIVQSTNNKSTGSVASLAKAFTSNNAQGNTIIVVCGVGNGTAPTISDTNSNTYTQASQVANGTALNIAVFYAVNIASGANTVTVNNGGSTASIAMEIYEVSGLLAQVTGQPDQTATSTGTSGTASTSAVSALSTNEYAFAGIGVGTAAQTITAGSGWTNDSGQQNPTTPAGLFSFISMSQYLGGLKSVTPQATFTSEPWAIAVATFRPVLLGVGAAVTGVAANLVQANQIPVSNAGQQGMLTITGTLTANSDNSLTFSGNSTVARRIRIQNESSGTIYWALDATASAGSPSLAAPAANAVMVEWISMACTTLHIFIPTGGTTTLNGSGGVKVSAWA